MVVRCERCRAEHVVPEEQVGPEGLALRCSGCGHVFKVRKKTVLESVEADPDERGTATLSLPLPPARGRKARRAEAHESWEPPSGGASEDPAWAAPRGASRPVMPAAGREAGRRKARRAWVLPLALLLALVGGAAAALLLVPSSWFQQPQPLAPPVSPEPTPSPPAEAPDAGSLPAPQAALPSPLPPPTTEAPPAGTVPGASAPVAGQVPVPGPDGSNATAGTPDPNAARVPPAQAPGDPGGRPGSRDDEVGGNGPSGPAELRPPSTSRQSELKGLLAEATRLRQRGQDEAALDAYGRALEKDPRNADALAGRGLCYLDLSEYRLAEASFQGALESEASHAGALLGLAETYRYEGRRADAAAYYQRYLAAHPEGRDASAARNALEALKGD